MVRSAAQPGRARSLLHPGSPSGVHVMESGTQTIGPAVRVGEAGRPDPHRHQVAGQFLKVGHRITGDPQQGCSTADGYNKVHVAVDDTMRLAYAEVLIDEQKPTVIGFLSRAVAWFHGQGIECLRVMSDYGLACVSRRSPRLAVSSVEAHPNQALHNQNQRQGRTLWPPADCVDIQSGRTEPLAASLHGDLQPAEEALCPALAFNSAAAR